MKYALIHKKEELEKILTKAFKEFIQPILLEQQTIKEAVKEVVENTIHKMVDEEII